MGILVLDQKALNHLIVFLCKDRARRVNKGTSGLYVLP